MRPLVIYHGGCRDGFCAAWVVHGEMPDAEFFVGYYGQPPPAVKGRTVYVIDFSYPREVMDQMFADSDSMLVLDHHKTAEAALVGAEYATFDMGRSGAGMAWDHFVGGKRPKLVDYVEDRDLWRHALPYSKEVNAWISTLEFDFAAWDDARLVDLEWMLRCGKVALAKTDQYVREVKKNARRTMFEGHDVPIVNAPQVDVSELGHALAQGEIFAMAWWQRADGVFQYSLRSHGDFDVSELAKRHGGGGHKNAAGFQSAVMIG
jgi:oligoribonuclease NrnB/cAMP/cGMP phosphodiesterase (DHH superfamily)